MADDSDAVVVDDDESKIVTKFLLNTCRLLQPTRDRVQAAQYLHVSASVKPLDDDDRHLIPLLNSATVDRVVSNGCDVVQVAHPLCRQDEWMNKCQRRLSFSRAEIVLLNSWMLIQQIAYHMLRSLTKTE